MAALSHLAGMPDSFAMWATFVLLAATITIYALEIFPVEGVALGSLCAFLLLFAHEQSGSGLSPGELLSGFANPALFAVLALIVMGQALFNTDALDAPSRWLANISGRGATRTLAVLLISAGVASALINNTPVVVMFIPILTTIAKQKGFFAARGLMPLSFIALLGGMTTLIGSSTNLLSAGIAAEAGVRIGMFDFIVPGAIVAGVGSLYVIFVLPRFLHKREGLVEEITVRDGRQFISQIIVSPGHRLEGARPVGGLFRELTDMTVRAILRNDTPILPPFEDVELRAGDALIVAVTRRTLERALATGSAQLPAAADEEQEVDGRLERDFTVAEAVIPPGSRYAARTISGSGIRAQEGVVVIGVQRKSHMQRTGLDRIRLEPGDTILVGGGPDAVSRLRASRDLLLLEWSAATVPARRNAPRALAIFAVTVALASTEALPIVVAALLGAFAMVATGCLNLRQAGRAFDSQIFMMVGAALAGASALEHTGGAQFIARSALDALSGQSPAVILSAFFLVLAILTNIISNNAVAVLFTPVAISLSQKLGLPPEPFVVAVIFAASCSFATPVGYQTNLLVMGPGHYTFRDFLLAGTPLVFLIWLTYSFVAPWYYGL